MASDIPRTRHPPGCENSPTESQKCRRLGVEYVGMKDREVLKTDASRHLIMQDAVQSSGKEAHCDDFEGLHLRSIGSGWLSLPQVASDLVNFCQRLLR